MERKNLCGQRIRQARVARNLKQVELSAVLSVDHKFELSQNAISSIETGVRTVTDKELVLLAKALQVSCAWLLHGNIADENSHITFGAEIFPFNRG